MRGESDLPDVCHCCIVAIKQNSYQVFNNNYYKFISLCINNLPGYSRQILVTTDYITKMSCFCQGKPNILEPPKGAKWGSAISCASGVRLSSSGTSPELFHSTFVDLQMT